jgi:YggT family protein
MTPLIEALLFLVGAIFGFYILLVLLRFLFQLVRASFYNPMAQFIVTITNPPLKPLRRLIPGLFGVDVASIVLLLVLQLAEIYLSLWILGKSPRFIAALAFAVVSLLKLTVWIYIIAILVRVVISWVNPYGTRHPASDLLASLTDPMLYRARRLLPPVSGLDLAPMVVSIALYLAVILLVRPLYGVAIGLDPTLAFLLR